MSSLALGLIACDKDDEDPVVSTTSTMTLDIQNLQNVGSDYTYEGWIIVEGAPVSTGTFNVDDNGDLSQTSFSVNKTALSSATAFVLSIEPVPDSDPLPSAIKILGGDFSDNAASVSTAHGAALGDDFTTAAGNYILATPTTTDMTDENSGLWFLSLASGSPAVGLTLPTLPSGWKYEGWAVINGSPVTTGTFTAVDVADDSAPFSGTDADGPTFPGEDYVMNAPSGQTFPTDLAGGVAVISIEPFPDNDPEPFQLKPLIGMISSSATDHVTYNLDNKSMDFPSGTVTR